jgi:hypothetical protein
MRLEDIMLSERGQSQRQILSDSTYTSTLSNEMESGGLGLGGIELLFNRCRLSFAR